MMLDKLLGKRRWLVTILTLPVKESAAALTYVDPDTA
jgi:hypothetical protein